jgi:hypothetical protein
MDDIKKSLQLKLENPLMMGEYGRGMEEAVVAELMKAAAAEWVREHPEMVAVMKERLRVVPVVTVEELVGRVPGEGIWKTDLISLLNVDYSMGGKAAGELIQRGVVGGSLKIEKGEKGKNLVRLNVKNPAVEWGKIVKDRMDCRDVVAQLVELGYSPSRGYALVDEAEKEGVLKAERKGRKKTVWIESAAVVAQAVFVPPAPVDRFAAIKAHIGVGGAS